MDNLLRLTLSLNASDLHLTPGSRPHFRINRELIEKPDTSVLSTDDIEKMLAKILSPEKKATLEERGDVDVSYELNEQRYRINVYKQIDGTSCAIRVISTKIRTISELGLPQILKDLARRPHGMLLVTGPANSGKSTTLAAILDQINSEKAEKIITFEDPIEYKHKNKKSIVDQRELGTHFNEWPNALVGALRQDPNVLLVGEMRDDYTTTTAMRAALAGTLVLGTLHTPGDSAQAISRIIDLYPPHQHQQIRAQLAQVILAIVPHQLLPRRDKKGLVAAVEVMIGNKAIQNIIREGKLELIHNTMETSSGMKTMDRSLAELVNFGTISLEEGTNRSIDEKRFRSYYDHMVRQK